MKKNKLWYLRRLSQGWFIGLAIFIAGAVIAGIYDTHGWEGVGFAVAFLVTGGAFLVLMEGIGKE